MTSRLCSSSWSFQYATMTIWPALMTEVSWISRGYIAELLLNAMCWWSLNIHFRNNNNPHEVFCNDEIDFRWCCHLGKLLPYLLCVFINVQFSLHLQVLSHANSLALQYQWQCWSVTTLIQSVIWIIGWIVVKFGAAMHGAQRINPNDFGVPSFNSSATMEVDIRGLSKIS